MGWERTVMTWERKRQTCKTLIAVYLREPMMHLERFVETPQQPILSLCHERVNLL